MLDQESRKMQKPQYTFPLAENIDQASVLTFDDQFDCSTAGLVSSTLPKHATKTTDNNFEAVDFSQLAMIVGGDEPERFEEITCGDETIQVWIYKDHSASLAMKRNDRLYAQLLTCPLRCRDIKALPDTILHDARRIYELAQIHSCAQITHDDQEIEARQPWVDQWPVSQGTENKASYIVQVTMDAVRHLVQSDDKAFTIQINGARILPNGKLQRPEIVAVSSKYNQDEHPINNTAQLAGARLLLANELPPETSISQEWHRFGAEGEVKIVPSPIASIDLDSPINLTAHERIGAINMLTRMSEIAEP